MEELLAIMLSIVAVKLLLKKLGGARKRTFAGLCKEMKKENSNIVGIYYQSQDGNFDYVRGSQE